MNIIKLRQEERKQRIKMIKDSIKNAETPDLYKLLMVCMSEWGISKRSAKELIEVAKWELLNDQIR